MSTNPVVKHVTKYDLDSGKLLGVGIVAFDAQPLSGQGWLAGHVGDLRTQYYDIAEDTIEPRIPLGASLSAASVTLGESVTLAPLPIPCAVRVDGVAEPVVVDDGSLEITPLSIGQAYRLTVDEVGYLRESFLFSVVDP
jgi:hypothetical protein